jgi:hypothetical protein
MIMIVTDQRVSRLLLYLVGSCVTNQKKKKGVSCNLKLGGPFAFAGMPTQMMDGRTCQ